MYMLFIGPPGSGKGTHARKLSQQFGMFHLSSGNLLRKAARKKSSGGQVIKRYIARGRLVPDEITVKLIRREIMKFREKDIIFDGFPRTVAQAERLTDLLEQIDKKIDLGIFLKVNEENLIYRLKGRRICSYDGSIYHVDINPPETEGKCDVCSANLLQPGVDEEGALKEKISDSKIRASKLAEYYKQRIDFKTVVGTDRSPKEVQKDIKNIVAPHIEE